MIFPPIIFPPRVFPPIIHPRAMGTVIVVPLPPLGPIAPFPVGVDPDFAMGLNALVQLEYDQGSTGASPSQHGAVKANYQPVPGTPAYRCRIRQLSSRDVEAAARLGVTASHKVLFANPLALDPRYRLRVLDPMTILPVNPPLVLVCRGKTDDAHRMGHHWVQFADQFEL